MKYILLVLLLCSTAKASIMEHILANITEVEMQIYPLPGNNSMLFIELPVELYEFIREEYNIQTNRTYFTHPIYGNIIISKQNNAEEQ